MADRASRNLFWSSLTRLEQLTLLSSILIWMGVLLSGIGLVVALLNRHNQQVAYASVSLPTPAVVESALATPAVIERALATPTATTMAANTPAASSSTTTASPTVASFPAGWSTATPTPPVPSPTVGTATGKAVATTIVSPTAMFAFEQPEVTPEASPTRRKPDLTPAEPPDQLVIPSIKLDSPVIPIGWQTVQRNGQTSRVWQVADNVVGWHKTSALPGQAGNVVLNGHHNIKGEVFRYLIDLEVGDRVWVHAKDEVYGYVVAEKHILKELGEPLEVRRQNAQWMNPTEDERLTMITCWPYTSNTHRLIVVAKPAPPGATE